jgi:large subunit ribosomal protein L25
MVKLIELTATAREKAGKGASRAIRKTGIIPAVIYGDKKTPVLIGIEEKVIVAQMNKPGFWTHQFEIDVDGEKIRTLCQDVQFHPVTDRPLHADFLRIAKDAELEMEIPLHVVGEDVCPGIKNRGVLNLVHRFIVVKCSPDNIPEKLELDISKLNVGEALTTSAITLPAGVKLADTEETTVLTIVGQEADASATTEATAE